MVALLPAAKGGEATVTLTVFEETQPLALVATTVYEVVTVGLAAMTEDEAPVFHTYVLPPLAVSVTISPAHITVFPEIRGAGTALTTTVADALPEHRPFVTATEYVVVPAGEMLIPESVEPLLHK